MRLEFNQGREARTFTREVGETASDAPGEIIPPGTRKNGRLETADRTDEIAHRVNATSVARVREAAEAPVVLDRRHHRVVIEGVAGTPCKAERPRDDQRQNVPTARVRVAATASVPKSC